MAILKNCPITFDLGFLKCAMVIIALKFQGLPAISILHILPTHFRVKKCIELPVKCFFEL